MKRYSNLPVAIKVLASVLTLLLIVSVIWAVARDGGFTGRSLVPALASGASLAAIISLAVTAHATWANWTRNRKKDTLEAWEVWKRETKEDRLRITRTLGARALTVEDAKALADSVTLEIDDRVLGDEEVKDLRGGLITILSGLERIAVGIEQKIYDRDTLMQLGGTIIIATYDRNQAYIHYMNHHDDDSRRQSRAYTALVALVTKVRSEDGVSRYPSYDAERVRHTTHSPSKPTSGANPIHGS